jgi:hypothetical protein
MKYIKFAALILTAALILCSCRPEDNEYVKDAQLSTANQNAKMLFAGAETFTTRAQIAGEMFDSYQYSGTLDEITEKPSNPEKDMVLTGDDLENGMEYYSDEPYDGVYKILLDEDYKPIAVLWAADEETSLVGAYPTMLWSLAENTSGNINTADINAAVRTE